MSDASVDPALQQMLDQQRWLLNNGFINDMHKDQLYVFGSIVHKDVDAVELSIDVDRQSVSYSLYVKSGLIKKISTYKKLSKSNSLFGLWRFKKLYEKEGNLDFHSIIGNFVSSYLGPRWSSSVSVVDIKEYEDGYTQNEQTDQQPDPERGS